MASYRDRVTATDGAGEALGEFIGDFTSTNEGSSHPGWGGQLESDDEDLLWALTERDDATLTLHLANGRSGQALIGDYQSDTGAIDVNGTGPRPF